MGAFVEPLAAAGFRVVTFDAPGHGHSTGRRSSLVEMADAVSDVGREFGPLYAIVAHSAGAAVTTMALADGLRVEQSVTGLAGIGTSPAGLGAALIQRSLRPRCGPWRYFNPQSLLCADPPPPAIRGS